MSSLSGLVRLSVFAGSADGEGGAGRSGGGGVIASVGCAGCVVSGDWAGKESGFCFLIGDFLFSRCSTEHHGMT